MSVKSVKGQVVPKGTEVWRKLQAELAKGAKLLTAKIADRAGFYEITYSDLIHGNCRTQISPRSRRWS